MYMYPTATSFKSIESNEPGMHSWQQGFADALYCRIPEGILAGFIAAPLPSLAIACMFAKGVPSLLAAAALVSGGVVAGVFLGMLWGIGSAGWDTWKLHHR